MGSGQLPSMITIWKLGSKSHGFNTQNPKARKREFLSFASFLFRRNMFLRNLQKSSPQVQLVRIGAHSDALAARESGRVNIRHFWHLSQEASSASKEEQCGMAEEPQLIVYVTGGCKAGESRDEICTWKKTLVAAWKESMRR